MMVIEEQSPDIASGVWLDHDDEDHLGAGDQARASNSCFTHASIL